MVCLQRSAAGKEVEDENDDREDEKEMNPAAHGVAADQSEDPKYKEDDGDRPKHVAFSR
jgi:hypothetical protein